MDLVPLKKHSLTPAQFEQLADVPPDVATHLKLCTLDSIGCGLYGAAQPWGKISGDVAVSFSGGGPSSLFGRKDKVSAPDAALANGVLPLRKVAQLEAERQHRLELSRAVAAERPFSEPPGPMPRAAAT